MKCPYCAEDVKDEAIICRYCHRELTAVRLQKLEEKLNNQLEGFEKHLMVLSNRIDLVESNLNLTPKTSSRTRSSFILALLIGGVAGISGIYFAIISNIISLLLLPQLVFIGIGIWAGFSEQDRAIKYYILLGFGIGAVNYLGVLIALLSVFSIQDLMGAFNTFLLEHFLLFATPFFLVILGAFIGEWLESKRPNGRKMDYPTELAQQIMKLSSEKDPAKKMDAEKLSPILAAIAPLIAAIGGIVVPIITLLYSQNP